MHPPRFPDEFWSQLAHRASAAPHFSDIGDVAWDEPWDRLLGLADKPDGTADGDDLAAEPRSIFLTETPHALCVPQGYEPNYPYPLLIWLHGTGGNEHELTELMPDISDRNYFGLSLRGPLPAKFAPGGFYWSDRTADLDDLQADIYEMVCLLRRTYHIHSERIFVAGHDDGAATALHLLLRKPEWFAGAIAFGGRFPRQPRALKRFRKLQEKRVLMGVGARDRLVSVADMVHVSRLYHAAGIDVTTRVYDAAHEVTREMLRDIDAWIQEGIAAGQLV
jgi:phospholipase/carboxylesterase